MTDNPQDNPQQSIEDLKSQLEAEVWQQEKADAGLTPETSGAQSDEAGQIDEGQRAAEPSTEADTPPNPEPSADAKDKDRPRDEHGKFLPKEAAKPTESEQPTEQQKEDSKYAKALKEQQRKEKTWRELEEDKNSFRQEREQFRQEMAQIRQGLSQTKQQPKPALQSSQFRLAVKGFEEKARNAYKEGEFDKAEEWTAYAQQADKQADEQQQVEFQAAQGQFNNEWQRHANEVVKDTPELADPNSDMAKEMLQLLQENPLLGLVPDGFKKGNEILQLRRQAAKSSGLEEENTKLKQQLDELRKKTAPSIVKDTAQHKSSGHSGETLEQTNARLRREVELEDAA